MSAEFCERRVLRAQVIVVRAAIWWRRVSGAAGRRIYSSSLLLLFHTSNLTLNFLSAGFEIEISPERLSAHCGRCDCTAHRFVTANQMILSSLARSHRAHTHCRAHLDVALNVVIYYDFVIAISLGALHCTLRNCAGTLASHAISLRLLLSLRCRNASAERLSAHRQRTNYTLHIIFVGAHFSAGLMRQGEGKRRCATILAFATRPEWLSHDERQADRVSKTSFLILTASIQNCIFRDFNIIVFSSFQISRCRVGPRTARMLYAIETQLPSSVMSSKRNRNICLADIFACAISF